MEPTARTAPSTAGEFAALATDTCRALARLVTHADTVWAIAHERTRTDYRDDDTPRRGSRGAADLSTVGDHRLRARLRDIANAELRLLAEATAVMNQLNAGPGPDRNLRGSMISEAEHRRLLKRARVRRDRGESETPLVAQPRRPKRGNR